MTSRCASRRQRSVHMRPPRDGGRSPKSARDAPARLRRVLDHQGAPPKTRRAKLLAAFAKP
jgi:hypothetical protein